MMWLLVTVWEQQNRATDGVFPHTSFSRLTHNFAHSWPFQMARRDKEATLAHIARAHLSVFLNFLWAARDPSARARQTSSRFAGRTIVHRFALSVVYGKRVRQNGGEPQYIRIKLSTGRPDRVSHTKWMETKQQLS